MTTDTNQSDESLRQITLVIYILYALSIFGGVTAIAAIIVNYLKRDEAAGTLYESHFTWQIRSFWWGLLWMAIGFITFFFFIGWVVMTVAGIWLLYRWIRGLLNWMDRKPMALDSW